MAPAMAADGTIWGGELFLGSIQRGFTRRAHLATIPLPGGEAAIRQPWRIAVAQLIALYGEAAALALPLAPVQQAGARQVRVIARMLEGNINTPRTSSAGRLFDLVAALVGVPGTQRTTYEGQAAIELELAAHATVEDAYPFRLQAEGDGWRIETESTIIGVVEDLLHTRPVALIAARFHRTMAEIVAACCARIREESGIGAVALSGGTFQNMALLRQVMELLTTQGFTIYRHRRVPTNDGGLALGQAVLADQTYRARHE